MSLKDLLKKISQAWKKFWNPPAPDPVPSSDSSDSPGPIVVSFLQTAFLFKDQKRPDGQVFKPNFDNSLQFFSAKWSDVDRSMALEYLCKLGANSMYFFLSNEDGPVTPYKSLFGGEFDETRIAAWQVWLRKCLAHGIHPIPMLFCDGSPKMHAARAEHGRFIARMGQAFKDLTEVPVLALEVSEYSWESSYINQLAGLVKTAFGKPCLIHDNREDSLKNCANLGGILYEYCNPARDTAYSAIQVYDKTLELVRRYPGKAIHAAESRIKPEPTHGLAAAFALASGCGSGFPPVLAEFISNLKSQISNSAPLTASRSGNIATLSQISNLKSSVIATANLQTGEFRKS